jgi:hypothetical protein
MKKSIGVLLFLIPVMGFSQEKEFGWLIGTWKIKGKNSYEVWKTSHDRSMLLGKSFDIRGADSVTLEHVKFRKEKGSFYYQVEHGGALMVPFKVTSFDGKKFVAENPKHDFPKIIRYELQNDGSMNAEIEGDGKVIPYYFERVR